MADVPLDDQAFINRALFELVISPMGRVNELTVRVDALRVLQQVGGAAPVSREEFEQVVTAVRTGLTPEAGESVERVHQLVLALKLPTQ